MFPLGLPALFIQSPKRLIAVMAPFYPESRAFSWTLLFVSWTIYLSHGVVYFRSRLPKFTWALFGVLILLLVFNVSGCQHILHNLSEETKTSNQ
jgi:hypothetical protein